MQSDLRDIESDFVFTETDASITDMDLGDEITGSVLLEMDSGYSTVFRYSQS